MPVAGERVRRHEHPDPAPDGGSAGAGSPRATYLRVEQELFLADLVVAETVDVLESFYEAPRGQVAEAIQSLLALPSIVVVDPALLLRAIEVYETDRLVQ